MRMSIITISGAWRSLRSWLAIGLLLILAQGGPAQSADQAETQKSKENVSRSSVSLTTSEPYGPQDEESKRVMDIIDTLKRAVLESDTETISKYLHNDCTSFNERTKKLISGKEKLLARFEEMMKEFSPQSQTPLKSYQIEHPYINVTGNRAIATYSATAKFGGEKPKTLQSQITEVFQKDGNTWKRLHYRCHWDLDRLESDKKSTGKVRKVSRKKRRRPPRTAILTQKYILPEDYISLSGGTKSLGTALRNISTVGIDLKRLSLALIELQREVQRNDLVRKPFGPYSSLLVPSGPEDYLQPRKQWLAIYTRETLLGLEQLVKDIENIETNTLCLIEDENKKDLLSKRLQEFKLEIQALDGTCSNLKKLTEKNAPFEEKRISQAIDALNFGLDSLVEIQKSLLEYMKKEN